ncbi:type I secretion system permease/ATPase [Neomegalonema sp.]|uniref:type I secretion system permease/ATPase n=1 Tax=Neomegalonema sp. TaxID=2039713 RepID=UPI002609A5A8|nr:type I secretion system permease/ATPase [Neomegalonema sp.]MDD2868408.1 type I secretion system permease/ATPase [Neomegalonema sp.]
MTQLQDAAAEMKGPLVGVGLFSAAINLLMLTGPVFMLQIYDRVLSSRSTATLATLFGVVIFLYGLMGLLDHCRGRVLARLGARFQIRMDPAAFAAVLHQADHPGLRERPAGALRDVGAIQTLMGSPAMGALFDLPWTPLFVLALFLFHTWLGLFALAGIAVALGLALLNQRLSRAPQNEAARLLAEAEARTEMTRKSIETVRGLGMVGTLTGLWRRAREGALAAQMEASDVGGASAVATRTFRIFLQSAILALGAWLVLRSELEPGEMIASSIVLGRALAPVEQIVGQWPQIQRAAAGWRSLKALFESGARPRIPMPLPRPEPRLTVENLAVVPLGSLAPVLQGVGLRAGPGDCVAVIGPSASGKSAFARALTGLWPAARGEIRLAGADLPQYDRDRLGRLIGYLPQQVELFPGTIAANIARFDPDPDPEAVVAAARAASAHELILGLPEGYDTVVTEGGGRLSGGQRQRIGLARAFYGDPVMLVLDEPNASLDDPGVQALNRAVGAARAAGKLIFFMTHRRSALEHCNLVLVLEGGGMRAFGPRDEVLRRVLSPQPPPGGGPPAPRGGA